MTEKSFYSSRQPLLLPPPSSLVLSPPPHLHQQVRTTNWQNFMVIFFQSGIQAKPLGFFQLLPHPPIPCNSLYFYVDHDQPDLKHICRRGTCLACRLPLVCSSTRTSHAGTQNLTPGPSIFGSRGSSFQCDFFRPGSRFQLLDSSDQDWWRLRC